jgi:hypothetical protein
MMEIRSGGIRRSVPDNASQTASSTLVSKLVKDAPGSYAPWRGKELKEEQLDSVVGGKAPSPGGPVAIPYPNAT